MKISKGNRRTILDNILKLHNPFGRYSEFEGSLTFLEKVWDLREMKSTDPRFKTALEDIRQHTINNDDWTVEYLLKDRLNLLEETDKIFIKFVETWISPEVRSEKDEIFQFVAVINGSLTSSTVRLILSDYFEGLPVYRLKEASKHRDLPLDIIENKIPFYKEDHNDKTYPCFILRYDRWDDYSFKTTFQLYYAVAGETRNPIGTLKILHSIAYETWDALESMFYALDATYCSLGQNEQYYYKFKETLGENFQSAILALRDCALFPKIQEPFENTAGFKKSLLRNDSADKVLRTIRYLLNGLDLKDCFKFSFTFKPQYAGNQINLNFDFDYISELPHRVYALIGKNGAGKTTLLASLANELRNSSSPILLPRNPLHAKIFTVSYSFFDRFEIPESDVSFNYVYCGLRKKDGGFLGQSEILERLLASANKIVERDLVNEWYLSLRDIVPEDLLSIAFTVEMYRTRPVKYEFNIEKFADFFNTLSSGQNILVFIVSEILSHIRPYSLILYDEPETHLHPNAISNLIATVFGIVNRFESFCIIATHSPIIIQELPSKCIYVLDRENEFLKIRRLEKESFGENLTVITEEIFGAIEVPKNYQTILKDLVDSGKTYEQIIDLLRNENLPVTLNTRLFIKGLMTQK